MHWVVARLTLWFNRYFIGYGQYRYARNERYTRSQSTLPRVMARRDPARRPGTHVGR
jgi:hypothetical protein